MSEKFGLMGLETQESMYLTGRTVLNCGDATAAEIDKEVMQILKDAYNEAKELLSANRDALDAIAAFLIEKETITGKEFMEIFRRVKGLPDPAEGEKKEERIAAKTDEAQENVSVADGSVIELPMQGGGFRTGGCSSDLKYRISMEPLLGDSGFLYVLCKKDVRVFLYISGRPGGSISL